MSDLGGPKWRVMDKHVKEDTVSIVEKVGNQATVVKGELFLTWVNPIQPGGGGFSPGKKIIIS